jgi:hypothetical protein
MSVVYVTSHRATFARLGIIDYEYVEYEPGQCFAHRTALPMGHVYHTFVFEAVPEGTRLIQTTNLKLAGLWRLAAPLLRQMFRNRLRSMNSAIQAYMQT